MLEKIKEIFESLSYREKILLGIMFITALLLVIFISGFYLFLSIKQLENQIKQNELTLDTVIEKRELLREALTRERLKRLEKKYRKPEPIGTILDKCANESGVTIPESKPQPDEVIAKGWVKHSVQFRLRREPLSEILDFMARIENYKRKFPIAITRFEIRKRFAEEDSYDVTMVVSTYEIVEREKRTKLKKKKKKEL